MGALLKIGLNDWLDDQTDGLVDLAPIANAGADVQVAKVRKQYSPVQKATIQMAMP